MGDECGVKPSLGSKLMTSLRECLHIAMLQNFSMIKNNSFVSVYPTSLCLSRDS